MHFYSLMVENCRKMKAKSASRIFFLHNKYLAGRASSLSLYLEMYSRWIYNNAFYMATNANSKRYPLWLLPWTTAYLPQYFSSKHKPVSVLKQTIHSLICALIWLIWIPVFSITRLKDFEISQLKDIGDKNSQT